MVKPFPDKNNNDKTKIICNYRISSARRVIENTFGILASRFRIFRRPIVAQVETVDNVVKASVALHNFLINIQHSDDIYCYCPVDYVDQEGPLGIRAGHWRREIREGNGLIRLQRNECGSNNFSNNAKQVRENFREYFNSPEGAVSWQDEIVSASINPFDIRDNC